MSLQLINFHYFVPVLKKYFVWVFWPNKPDVSATPCSLMGPETGVAGCCFLWLVQEFITCILLMSGECTFSLQPSLSKYLLHLLLFLKPCAQRFLFMLSVSYQLFRSALKNEEKHLRGHVLHWAYRCPAVGCCVRTIIQISQENS